MTFDHEWSSDKDVSTKGPCIWCGVANGTTGPCTKHPRADGSRPIPTSVVELDFSDRIKELRAEREAAWKQAATLDASED